jgi:hypothetical protein
MSLTSQGYVQPAIPDDDELTDDDLAKMTGPEREAYAAALEEDAEDAAPAPQEPTQAAEPAQQPQREPEPAAPVLDLSPKIAALEGAQTEAQQKLAELTDQWDNGELEEEKYRQERAALEAQMRRAESEAASLRSVATMQEVQREQQEAAEKARLDREWEKAATAFSAKHAEFVAPDHFDGFNAVLEGVTANAKFAVLPFEKQLDIAARTYVAQVEAAGGTAPSYQAQQPPSDVPPRPQKGEKPEPPPTLAALPQDSASRDPNMSEAQMWAARLDAAANFKESEAILAQIPVHLRDAVLEG